MKHPDAHTDTRSPAKIAHKGPLSLAIARRQGVVVTLWIEPSARRTWHVEGLTYDFDTLTDAFAAIDGLLGT
jgi:hypothetical protein